MDPHGRSARVLVVESDPESWNELEALLAEGEWQVERVASTREAAAALGQTEPRVLVVASELDDGDGVQLLAELRQRRRAAVGVVLTSAPDLGEAVRALEAGAAGYLAKPLGEQRARFHERLEAAAAQTRELAVQERLKEKYRLTSEELGQLRVETGMTRDVMDERVNLARGESAAELADREARIDELSAALRREFVFLLSLGKRMSLQFSSQPVALRSVLQELELAGRHLEAILGEAADGDQDEEG